MGGVSETLSLVLVCLVDSGRRDPGIGLPNSTRFLSNTMSHDLTKPEIAEAKRVRSSLSPSPLRSFSSSMIPSYAICWMTVACRLAVL